MKRALVVLVLMTVAALFGTVAHADNGVKWPTSTIYSTRLNMR